MDPVHLTAAQCRYLHLGPSADGEITPQGDLTILDQDRDGWIFVAQTSDALSFNPMVAEGCGVWVDPRGYEHYGSSGRRDHETNTPEEAARFEEHRH